MHTQRRFRPFTARYWPRFRKSSPVGKQGTVAHFRPVHTLICEYPSRYGLNEIQEACEQLAESGFLEIKNGTFAHPTDLREQLIAAVAGTPRIRSRAFPPPPTVLTW